MKRALLGLLAAVTLAVPALAGDRTPNFGAAPTPVALTDKTGHPIDSSTPVPVNCVTGCTGSGGGGDASAANQTSQITQETAINTALGGVTASPTANTVLDRLKTIHNDLAAPLTVSTHAVTQSGSWLNGVKGLDGSTIASGSNRFPVDGGGDWLAVTTTPASSAATIFDVDVSALPGASELLIEVAGNASGNTVSISVSNDDATFGNLQFCTPLNNSSSAPSNTFSTSTAGTMYQCPIKGRYMKGVVTSYVSGSTTLTAYLHRGSPASTPKGYVGITDASNVPYVSISNGFNVSGGGTFPAGLAAQCDDTGQTALTENNWGAARLNCLNHTLLIRPFESSANTWQATVSLSDTTNTALHASCGAGLKNYVTSLDYSGVATTVADELDLNDNTTPIWKANIAAGATSRSLMWDSPKAGTAATAMNVALTGSPTGAVIVNASGYCAP